MTFEEWKVARDNSVKFAQETIESMKKSHSELCELLGSTYTKAITDEVRDYNENIMITLIEEDLFQIAAVLNKIAEGSVKTPEATSRKAEWIPKEENGKIEYYKCSVCGYGEPKTRNYCPHCGEKMFVKTHDVYEEFLKEATHDTE